ncbi:hypothetical protein PG984_013420 [Apiospora sp. TS-2023a]
MNCAGCRTPSQSTQLLPEVSGDYNHIYLSPIFAHLAGLPGPIMPIIPGPGRHSTSRTFADPRGLFQATPSAQPAVTLMERKTLAHISGNGLIKDMLSNAT